MPATTAANRLRFTKFLRAISMRTRPTALLSLAIGYAHRIFKSHPELDMSENEMIDEIVHVALKAERPDALNSAAGPSSA